jgi:hypothetical protein
LYRKRKGRQRLKRRDTRKVLPFETNTDLSYSNHLRLEKFYGNNEKIYKKNQSNTLCSSFLQFNELLQTLQYLNQN